MVVANIYLKRGATFEEGRASIKSENVHVIRGERRRCDYRSVRSIIYLGLYSIKHFLLSVPRLGIPLFLLLTVGSLKMFYVHV